MEWYSTAITWSKRALTTPKYSSVVVGEMRAWSSSGHDPVRLVGWKKTVFVLALVLVLVVVVGVVAVVVVVVAIVLSLCNPSWGWLYHCHPLTCRSPRRGHLTEAFDWGWWCHCPPLTDLSPLHRGKHVSPVTRWRVA